jgi:hypothetical protein
MKTIKIIFTGSIDQTFENFTVGRVYLAREVREGVVLVLDDKACLVEMASYNFDFEESEQLSVSINPEEGGIEKYV